jgi:hypothetical protein
MATLAWQELPSNTKAGNHADGFGSATRATIIGSQVPHRDWHT